MMTPLNRLALSNPGISRSRPAWNMSIDTEKRRSGVLRVSTDRCSCAQRAADEKERCLERSQNAQFHVPHVRVVRAAAAAPRRLARSPVRAPPAGFVPQSWRRSRRSSCRFASTVETAEGDTPTCSAIVCTVTGRFSPRAMRRDIPHIHARAASDNHSNLFVAMLWPDSNAELAEESFILRVLRELRVQTVLDWIDGRIASSSERSLGKDPADLSAVEVRKIRRPISSLLACRIYVGFTASFHALRPRSRPTFRGSLVSHRRTAARRRNGCPPAFLSRRCERHGSPVRATHARGAHESFWRPLLQQPDMQDDGRARERPSRRTPRFREVVRALTFRRKPLMSADAR